jgi:hypothetical protein
LAQAAMLDGLDELESVEFMRLLRKAIATDNEGRCARQPEGD